MENDPEALKWDKPAKGHFQIYYASGPAYEPDFVVETKTGKYLCEPKSVAEMEDPEVLAKAKAAAKAKAEAHDQADAKAKAQAEAKALEEAKNQKDEGTNASSCGEGDKPAPPPMPRRRGRALPARTVRTTVDGDHVRVPYTFRKDQLVALEQMKATLYAKTGKWIDKSTLMREALDLLIAQFPELTGKTEQVSRESEAA